MFRKVTFTLPEYLVQELEDNVKKGEKSSFVADAMEAELVKRRLKYKTDPIKSIDELREKLPKVPYKKMMDAIERGRV